MNDKKKQLLQVAKFTLFSISAGLIQIGSFALLEIFIKTYWIPYLASLLLSIANSHSNPLRIFPLPWQRCWAFIWCSLPSPRGWEAWQRRQVFMTF